MDIKNYRDLIVWQKAMLLVEEAYALARKLPKEETYALSDQIRRSAVSVPSNIAEGQGKETTRDFLHYLSIAKGSVFELETQLMIGVRLNYFSEEETQQAMALSGEVGKMLNSLISRLSDH